MLVIDMWVATEGKHFVAMYAAVVYILQFSFENFM